MVPTIATSLDRLSNWKRRSVHLIILFLAVTGRAFCQPAISAVTSSVASISDNDAIVPSGAPPIVPMEQTPPAESTWSGISDQKHVNWNGLLRDASTFLAVEHAFRIATEPGTREGMKGPFFKDYWRAVSSLHGWADGDEFYVNYIGHSMQGAIAGYLFVQNDIPEYRYSVFGENREYWKSRLRALAFSYAYSVQFEIGLASEASIGGIQSKFPQQGFVDHVITPVVGMGWMVAEDALDKYVIQRFEARVRNPYARLMVRGWLNPSRSFANLMKFEVPWHRDTRPDLFGPNPKGEAVQRILASRPTMGPNRSNADLDPSKAVVAPFEFDLRFQASQYVGKANSACLGAGGTAGFRVASRWQAVADIGGCKLRGLPTDWSGDSLHYLVGLRWTPWAARKWSIHAQLLGGGEKMTREVMFPVKKAQLYAAWQQAGANPDSKPTHEQYTSASDVSGPSMQGGIGVSYRLNGALQLNAASADYRRSWLPTLDGMDYTRSLTFTTGLTLRMGTW